VCLRASTDGGSTRPKEAGLVEIILIIAAVILLVPMVALWIDDERTRTRAKTR
jgi:hypothetical protein